MRLTLTLHDYLDKYLDIVIAEQTWCPICYEQAFQLDRDKDIKHLVACYKELQLEIYFRKQVEMHGEVLDISNTLLRHVDAMVKDEMTLYHLKYFKQEHSD